MITKAIVEQILTPYQVRVRIPILDRLTYAPMSASTSELNIATICCLPNCYMNVQVGDVVFIGFEDNTYDKAVILGHLSREAMNGTYSDVNFGTLTVRGGANLPVNTHIGNVNDKELSCLSGVYDNIQAQINDLKQQVDDLKQQVELLAVSS